MGLFLVVDVIDQIVAVAVVVVVDTIQTKQPPIARLLAASNERNTKQHPKHKKKPISL
jgi:hypothetical protein